MKKILLLTPLYPSDDTSYKVSHICHYFATEWVNSGYDVRVINLTVNFPKLYFTLAKPFLSLIEAKTGCTVFLNNQTKPTKYKLDGINILNVPIKKYYPHQYPSPKTCKDIAKIINDYLIEYDFIPDYITGHLLNPTLGIIIELKKYFTAKTCIVLHTPNDNILKLPNKYKSPIGVIDVWGFRYKPLMDNFKKKLPHEKTFVCYSGIPETYLSTMQRNYKKGINNFCFLGSLYKLKRVDLLIRAISNLKNNNSKLNIIGDGNELKNLKKQVKNLKLNEQVIFWGKQPREYAQQILNQSDCFMMISQEAFGLVYLEAMSKGLITIGLKGSGIDGVIIDGVNGFLCESQDEKSLVKKILEIRTLTSEELSEVSKKAIETAKKLTDKNAAYIYISSVRDL